MFLEDAFGDTGTTVVVEEFLEGPDECSLLVVTDGTYVVPLATAQDPKRALHPTTIRDTVNGRRYSCSLL